MPIPGQREPLVLVVVLVLDHLADGKLFCADGRPVPNGAKLRGYCHLNRNLNPNPNLDLNLLMENGLRLRLRL